MYGHCCEVKSIVVSIAGWIGRTGDDVICDQHYQQFVQQSRHWLILYKICMLTHKYTYICISKWYGSISLAYASNNCSQTYRILACGMEAYGRCPYLYTPYTVPWGVLGGVCIKYIHNFIQTQYTNIQKHYLVQERRF